jgi:hypothetical protein
VIILSRICGATIKDRVWIDNWVYWITLNYSYSVLQCTHLQLTTVDHNIRVATAPQPVFHCTVSAEYLTTLSTESLDYFTVFSQLTLQPTDCCLSRVRLFTRWHVLTSRHCRLSPTSPLKTLQLQLRAQLFSNS